MILRILALTLAVLISPSLGGMRQSEFDTRFEDMCFQKYKTDPYLINGQETPLSNTLENFISLAEKFEIVNPQMPLKEELFYFIRNYIFENIQISIDGSGKLTASQWKPTLANMDEVNDLWEPDAAKRDPAYQPGKDPFAPWEKCSLYYMISHSILSEPGDQLARYYSDTNTSRTDRQRSSLDIHQYYPQEIGVVAIHGTDAAVSLSRVLVGMYVGLNQARRKELLQFERFNKDQPQESLLPPETDRTVDPLFTLTMAEVLMMAGWDISARKGLAPNGEWVSTPLGTDGRIDGFCPMVYKQQIPKDNKYPAYSYSTVRGAADGLILGMAVPAIEGKKSTTRLSQILRMYYSRIGVPVDQSNGIFRSPRVSFCNRQDTLGTLEPTIEQQMRLYGFLVTEKFSAVDGYFEIAKRIYESSKPDVFDINGNTVLKDYCGERLSLETPENLPRSTNLDVFVFMDSRNSETNFQTQQMIVGYLAMHLDLRHTGSRMTILLDHKVNTASTTAKIDLKPVVIDEYSSSCAACAVAQIAYEPSNVDRDQIVLAIDQLLEERKTKEAKYNGANGKVVIYFNFETEDGRRDNNKIQSRLDKALRDLHLRHSDALLYAVGLETELLKRFSRNDATLVFLAKETTEEEIAKKLYEKIANAPGLLQYPDCTDGRGESSATYENYVTPLTLQHWKMPAKYFYKSTGLKVMFESSSGPIKVCRNRATMWPENQDKYCMNTSSTIGTGSANRIEFSLSNPCKNLDQYSCPPFYFAVMGVNSNGDNRPRDFCSELNNDDHWCSTLDDIKFKVSHEGMRCSGSFGLAASTAIILFATLFSFFLHKTF